MSKAKNDGFAGRYPVLARWVAEYGTLEIGYDPMTNSFVRALENEGGIIWQGRTEYKDIDRGLLAAETAVARWLKKQFGVTFE